MPVRFPKFTVPFQSSRAKPGKSQPSAVDAKTSTPEIKKIPKNQDALKGYTFACLATGSPLDNMPTALLARETMEEASHKLPLGAGNRLGDLEKSRDQSKVHVQGADALRKALVNAFNKGEAGKVPLTATELSLLKCFPPGIAERLHGSGGNVNDYAFDMALGATALLAKAGNCGEQQSAIKALHGPKLASGQTLMTVDIGPRHGWAEIAVKPGQVIHPENLTMDTWGWKSKGPMTPIQREHGYYTNLPEKTRTSMLLREDLAPMFSRDVDHLLRKIQKNPEAQTIYTDAKYGENQRLKGKYPSGYGKYLRKHMETNQLQSHNGVTYAVHNPFSDKFREETRQALESLKQPAQPGRAITPQILAEVMAVKVGRDVDKLSTKIAVQQAPKNVKEFSAIANKVIVDQPSRSAIGTLVDRVKQFKTLFRKTPNPRPSS